MNVTLNKTKLSVDAGEQKALFQTCRSRRSCSEHAGAAFFFPVPFMRQLSHGVCKFLYSRSGLMMERMMEGCIRQ